MLFRVILVALAVISLKVNATENSVDIYIRDDVYEDYLAFVANRNIIDIKQFSGQHIRRDVVDMIIAQKALMLGGFTANFHYHPGKINFRNTKLLQQGKLLLSFDSYWLTDANAIKKDVYISSPVIRRGEYIAGLYTSPNNEKALKLQKLNELTQFTAVSTPRWRTDWATLQALPLKKLIAEHEWLSMARMVSIGWVDFMLMPFNSTDDQSFTLGKIHLVPIPKIAVVLKDSRHFVISKKHPYGKQAFDAIQKGLTILRKKKAIVTAYTQAGFFVDKQQYHILNSQ